MKHMAARIGVMNSVHIRLFQMPLCSDSSLLKLLEKVNKEKNQTKENMVFKML